MKKLIAIDGNSLMYRAYYALPAMTTRTGWPTGALYGFLGMLFKLLDTRPDYLAVAFDLHGPTFRHETFEAYKAGRKPMPDDLRPQFPLLKRVLTQMRIPIFECERYEADDILGVFSRLAGDEGVEALLVTGDRDALQLVSDSTTVLLTRRGITDTVEYTPALLQEQYGLTPEGMIDLKALMGDASDNIPGVEGVGEKTALKLLHEYGTLEGVLAGAGEVKGKLGEKLVQQADNARLSYQLGRIDTHAPLDVSLADAAFDPSHMADAVPVLQELELRSFIQRIPRRPDGGAVANSEFPPVKTIPVANARDLAALRDRCLSANEISVDLDESLTIALNPSEQYRVEFQGTLLEPGLEPAGVIRELAPVFARETPIILAFDGKRLMRSLSEHGVELRGLAFDAMVADYLLHAVRPTQSLKDLCAQRAGDEAAVCARLFPFRDGMRREMEEQRLTRVYEDIERPLIDTLYDMERIGFMVDANLLAAQSETFGERAAELEKQIYAHAPEPFNILSPKQLGTFLFETLNLPYGKKTRTGYSTDAEVLESLADLHPAVALVQEYRFLTKLKSTFLDVLVALAREGDGRIHTTFQQAVAATGRISSKDPNLQNIPARTQQGREIRKAFIPSPGNVLVGADYSQIELRLLAHMSQDERLTKAFLEETDIHTRTASEVFGIPVGEVDKFQRNAAKAVNFGIIYGISDFGLARNLGVTRAVAGAYIKKYLERYPGVQEYMHRSVEEGRRLGYASTIFGRRRELPELKSSNYNTRSFGERVAMNMPLQGSAADIIKIAMNRVRERLLSGGYASRLILQVHDELIVDAAKSEAQAVKELLMECMQNVVTLSVPLVAAASVGESWYDTK